MFLECEKHLGSEKLNHFLRDCVKFFTGKYPHVTTCLLEFATYRKIILSGSPVVEGGNHITLLFFNLNVYMVSSPQITPLQKNKVLLGN